MPFQIRLAAEADLPGIGEIEVASFSDPWPRSSFLLLFGNTAWVAESEGRVIGYLFARTVADEAEVLNLAVHPRYRRFGVARALLGHAMESFRAAGARQVYLEVRETNADARNFYRNSGFVERGRRRQYYEHPPEDAIVMGRPITPRGDTEKKGS